MGPALAELVGFVAREPDCDRALRAIALAAIEHTGSRHALIAMLNESVGRLEVKHGAGDGFREYSRQGKMFLSIGREDGIVSFVAATGNTVQTGNVAEDPRYKRIFEGTQSELAVPIRDQAGRIRGVLNVESDMRDAYGDPQRESLLTLAHLISLVLEHMDHSRREEALIQIGSALDTSLTEEALIDRVIRVAEDVLSFQACSVFLLDPKTNNFVLKGTIGALKDKIGKLSYQRGEGFTGWVCEHGEPILLNQPQADPRWKGKYVEIPSDMIASFLAVPITSRHGSIGAIRALRQKADNPFLDNRFTQNDLRLLQAIAEQVASGLENVRNMERIIHSERMIAWGELSAKSSHMIGNRVFALKGDVNELAHLLEDNPLQADDLKEIQRSLSTNVQRVEEILQDFRDFVTATQLHRETVDFNKIVKETVEEVFPKRSNFQLDMDLQETPETSLDDKKIRRAISELIENSLNHMDHGRLRVATRVVDSTAHPRTKNSKVLKYLQLEVEDSGPGVGSERKQLIFQPFHSSRVKGMGLGLSIVKGIVDAHGGQVFEAGTEGEGAKFVILLPIT